MTLPNWLYDLLKWVALICLPAFKIAIPALFEVWHWSYGEEIAKTLDIFAVLLGTLIGVSCATYKAEPVITRDPEDREHHIEVDNGIAER